MNAPLLKLIVLKTHDVESLREFYIQLGFEFVQEQHGNGPVHFSASLGDGILEIYPLKTGQDPDTTTRLGFTVSNLETIMAKAAESERVVSTPRQTDWGLRAVMKDPDGRVVELYQ